MKRPNSTSLQPQIRSVADLARFLDLSDWTVSRAINGSPAVKRSTRERVLNAMKESGFEPDPLARGLRGKINGLVGICFGEYRNMILIEKLASLEAYLRDNGFRSILAFTGNDAAAERRALAEFKRLRVEAVVLVQSHLAEEQADSEVAGIARIYVDPIYSHSGLSVSLDRNKGVELLVKHLAALGHRQFGVLGFTEANVWRWPGMRQAFADLEFDLKKQVQFFEIPEGEEFRPEFGPDLADAVLSAKSPPTALLALSDLLAVSVIQSLNARGIRVPEDFSVTGFDNLGIARCFRPKLTTIDQRPDVLIRAAGDLLFRQLRQPKAGLPQPVLIAPALIVGDSTAQRRKGAPPCRRR